MINKQQYIRISFIKDSDIKFANPDTGKKAWYGSDYAQGTYIDVLQVISGNETEIRVICMDGEIGILRTNDVKILPVISKP